MTIDAPVLEALAYIVALQETNPELAELLMRAALDALEVQESQTVFEAESRN